MHRLVVVRAGLVAMTSLLIGGCSADPERRGDANEDVDGSSVARDDAGLAPLPARSRFHDALERQDFARLPEVIADLEAADIETDGDGSIVLSLGLANLWGAAEIGRRPEAGPLEQPTFALAAERAFVRAKETLPDDARIDGWLGAVRARIGVATGSDELVARGKADVEAGIERHPEFNLFVRALVFGSSNVPADVAIAEESLWQALEACGQGATAMSPTLEEPLVPVHSGPDRVCWNGARAPHNLEGFFLFAGDIVTKRGDAARAGLVYANARKADGFETWPFRELLEERITKADERAALFADGVPENDPQLVSDSEVSCAYCHAR